MTHDDIKATCERLLASGKLPRAEAATVRMFAAARSYSRRNKETISALVRRYLS